MLCDCLYIPRNECKFEKLAVWGSDMSEAEPRLPRRLFLAAGLSAVAVGGAVALGALGLIDVPETQSFAFSRATNLASGEEARLRGFLVKAAQDARLTVVITGHTGSQGDATANLALSEERAQAVAAIAVDVGLDASALTVTGVGGGAPLPRAEGQSDRAYQTALARAEVTLQVRR